jgi:hypothetical protein
LADVVPFKRPSSARRHQGKTLCRNGHHKWRADKARQFDVKQGRLVTRYVCERCGKEKVRAD